VESAAMSEAVSIRVRRWEGYDKRGSNFCLADELSEVEGLGQGQARWLVQRSGTKSCEVDECQGVRKEDDSSLMCRRFLDEVLGMWERSVALGGSGLISWSADGLDPAGS